MGIFNRKRGRVIPLESGQPDSFIIGQASDVLAEGGTMVFPTDTVYGLGCRADRLRGVRDIYRLKGRDYKKPLALLLDSPNDLSRVAIDLPDYTGRLMEKYWPGPLTLVVPASPEVLGWKVSQGPTVGLRVPDHQLTREIIRQAGAPLATTSANLSGAEDARSVGQAISTLKGTVDLVLDGGELPRKPPSTVLDVTGECPTLLRRGGLSRHQLAEAAGRPVKLERMSVLFVCTGNTCRSPMAEGLLRHMLPPEWRPRVLVRSCGTGALPGMPAAENSRLAARRHGFEIENHRSMACTRGILEEADLVIAMEQKHRQDVNRLVPGIEVRLMSVDGVPDPIGGGLEDYLQTMELLKREMPDVLELIKQELR